MAEARPLRSPGEKALRILAPVSVKERDAAGEDTGERRVFFKTAFVFELSQTDPLPGVEPVALRAPCVPLTGDSHAHLLAPLGAFAESLGYAVSFEAIDGSAGGWCDLKNKRIVVDAQVPPNAQLRTLIHECAHALGIDYEQYSRAQAEVMVDTVTLLAASSVGLQVDGETIPYVAGWGEHGVLEAVTEFAETIDRIARRIEDVLLASADQNRPTVRVGAAWSARRSVAVGEQLAVDLANGVELLARVGEGLLDLEGVRVGDGQLRA